MDRFEIEILVRVNVYVREPKDDGVASVAKEAIYQAMRDDIKQVETFYSDIINSRPLRIPGFLSEERKRFLIELFTGKPWKRPDLDGLDPDEVPRPVTLDGVSEPN